MEQTTLEYAVMSTAAYISSRTSANVVGAPAGWTVLSGSLDINGNLSGDLSHVQNLSDGFEATAYQQGNKIVISFAGTNPVDLNEWITDLDIGSVGSPNQQILDSALYYKAVQAQYPDAEISFTGHSLGGGLAALMGVFFDKPAVTFDPAPFRLAATETNAEAIAKYLAQNGFTAETVPLNTRPNLAAALFGNDILGENVYPVTIRGENNISAYALDGEMLTNGIPLFADSLYDLRIMGDYHLIEGDNFSSGLTFAHYHMAELLLITMADPRLSTLSTVLPDLYGKMYNQYFDLVFNLPITNFVTHLIQQEYDPNYGGQVGGRGIIKAFADDIALLAQTTGENATTEILADRGLQDAYMGLVIDYYYNLPNDAALTPCLTVSNGMIEFDTQAVTRDDLVGDLVTHLNGNLHVDEIAGLALNLIGRESLLQWHIQYDGDRALLVDESNQTQDVVVGNKGNDLISTGGGNDIIYAGEGNDIISGGTGADIMAGGAGNDTYVVDHTGDMVNEGLFAGVDTVQSSISYTLGLNLENLTLTGSAIAGTGNLLDNIIIGDAANNVLTGLLGNDQLFGGAGNDTLLGGLGNDVLNGGTGNDILNGNGGMDTYIFGRGFGHDIIRDFDLLGGNDVLKFDASVKVGDITLSYDGMDLLLSIKGTNDSIEIENWRWGYASQIERFEFADGHTYNSWQASMLSFA